MKIRQGFVSNSSTSSFILAGIAIGAAATPDEDEAIVAVARQLGIKDPDQCFDFFDILYYAHLTYWYDDDRSLFYIGTSLGDIEEDVVTVDPATVTVPPDVLQKLQQICQILNIPCTIRVYAGTVTS